MTTKNFINESLIFFTQWSENESLTKPHWTDNFFPH